MVRGLTESGAWVAIRNLALACLLSPLGAQAGAPLPRGEVIPKVVCAKDPTFSYAVYLPSTYQPDRPWPVLFGLSPNARGVDPVSLFRLAAERFGWIVVGSNDCRNGQLRPALLATEALWKDVNARFNVDPKRSYSAGFSGGARMALRLALKHPGRFAGLVSIGAFGTPEGLLTGLGHLHFHLSSGVEDFNHWDVLQGWEELHDRSWSVLRDQFPGGHRWAPEQTAQAAVAFLQWEAMRDGLIPLDAALQRDVVQSLVGRAERAGRSLEALRRWKDLAALIPNTPEGHEAMDHLADLGRDPVVTKEQVLEGRYREASAKLDTLRGAHYLEAVNGYLQRLKGATPLEQVMLRRLLGKSMADYYLTLEEAFQKQAWEQVLDISRSLRVLDEREGWPHVYAAMAMAQMGKSGEALAQLEVARTKGFHQVVWIRAQEALKPLQSQPAYEAILKEMETGSPR